MSEAKLPPQALEIEQAVLGSMLIEPEAVSPVINLLSKEDFYKPAHQHIFEAIFRLHERKNNPDILTVENELKDNNLLDSCGGVMYLSELTNAVSSAANVEYHAQILSEKSLKRKLINSCSSIIETAYDTTSDAFDTLDGAEQKIFNLANLREKKQTKNIKDLVNTSISRIEKLMGKSASITGVPTGTDVDKFTTGWQPGDMIIIAARPSMGKTAFALTAARNAAMHPNPDLQSGVALFSLEMSAESLVQRLLTMEARVDAQKVRMGRLDSQDFQRIIEAAGRLYKADIFIDDTPSLSITELRSKCRRLKTEHNIGLVMVDYLQLMTAKGLETSSREQEIAAISRGIKALAMEISVPVIALSQLSRAVEQRGGDKRPQLSDLRESGSIEQDADVVMFLYRPEYYGKTTTEDGQSTEGLAEVIIGKQRNGPVGTVPLLFHKQYTRFENLTQSMASPFDDGGGSEAAPPVPDFPADTAPIATDNANPGPPPLGHDPGGDDEAPF